MRSSTTGRSARGFSVLELVVTLALSGMTLAALMGLLVATARSHRTGWSQAGLQRQGEVALARVEVDLGYAGLGLPRAASAGLATTPPQPDGTEPPTAAQIPHALRSVVQLGPDRLMLVGDFPRPDADHVDFGPIDARAAKAGVLAWHTDSNGTCMPAGCDIGALSLAVPGLGGCASTGSGDDEGGSRSCPWGLTGLQAGDTLQIVVGGQPPRNVQLAGERADSPPRLECATPTERCGVRLQGPLPSIEPDDVRAAWVTSIDRVFWWKAGSELLRQQCWGPVHQGDATWPSAQTQASFDVGRDVSKLPGTECSPTEVVARGVTALAFVPHLVADEVVFVDVKLQLASPPPQDAHAILVGGGALWGGL